METREAMGATVNRFREHREMSYADLVFALAIGPLHVRTNVETLRRICTGHGKPPETIEVEMVLAIAYALGVTVRDLSEEVDRRLRQIVEVALTEASVVDVSMLGQEQLPTEFPVPIDRYARAS